eukprot:scaffold6875_cov159-Ochromonas_danica.AAC.1
MKRWLHAIDMVIRNNMVRKARVYLDKKGLNIAKGLPRKRSTYLLSSPIKQMIGGGTATPPAVTTEVEGAK